MVAAIDPGPPAKTVDNGKLSVLSMYVVATDVLLTDGVLIEKGF